MKVLFAIAILTAAAVAAAMLSTNPAAAQFSTEAGEAASRAVVSVRVLD